MSNNTSVDEGANQPPKPDLHQLLHVYYAQAEFAHQMIHALTNCIEQEEELKMLRKYYVDRLEKVV